MMRAVRHRQAGDLRRWGGALAAAAAVVVCWPTVAGVFLFDDAPVVRDNALVAVDALLYDPGWRAWLRGEAAPPNASLGSRALASNLGAAVALFAALLCKETAAGALAALAVVVLLRAAQRRRPPPSLLLGL